MTLLLSLNFITIVTATTASKATASKMFIAVALLCFDSLVLVLFSAIAFAVHFSAIDVILIATVTSLLLKYINIDHYNNINIIYLRCFYHY